MFGGKRDFYQALGYTTDVSLDSLRNRYDRGDISGRIVDRCRQPPVLANFTDFEQLAVPARDQQQQVREAQVRIQVTANGPDIRISTNRSGQPDFFHR